MAWNPLIGLGFASLGIGYLWEWSKGRRESPTPLGSDLNGMRGIREGHPWAAISGRQALGATVAEKLPYTASGKRVGTGAGYAGVREMDMKPAGNIMRRVSFIRDQIRKDSLDRQVITEARTLVSQRCPTVNGGVVWCQAVKDWKSEVARVFRAVTNPNSPMAVRYTRDHAKVDLFASSALQRRLPAEDCDGMCVRTGALLRAIGYSIKLRIVAPAGKPGAWAHIYLVVGVPPGEDAKWLPLDVTEAQHGPFWEVPANLISSKRDFDV